MFCDYFIKEILLEDRGKIEVLELKLELLQIIGSSL